MTGSEFYAYLLRTFKRPDKATECYEAITDTIADIKTRHPFELFNVETYSSSLSTVGDYKIDLPTDLGHLTGAVRVYDGDYAVTLAKLSKYDFDRMYPNPNDTDVEKGFPQHYCVFGGQILVSPPVDKTGYTVEFSYSTKSDEEVTAATASVAFSTVEYRKMLLFGTLYFLFATLENDEQSAKYKQLYEQELVKHIEADKEVTDAPCIMDIHQF